MKLLVPAVLSALALTMASFQSKSGLRAPYVVPPLTPPNGEVILFRAFADGVQVYECRDGASGAQWIFRGPEADLADDRSVPIGKHYAGPTWESIDGSKVVAHVVASVDASDPTAIPHVLLKADSATGSGMFARVRSIQRLQTAGGRAPKEACSAATLTRVAKVPYSATYYFYGDAPAAY